MENIVFERDYSQDRKQDDRCDAIFQRAMFGSFAKDYQEAMEKIPKVVVPEYKENYEYLLRVCDDLAQQWGGSVRGVVSFQSWDAQIDLDLPVVEFSNTEELQLLRDIAEKSHSVSFQPNENGGLNVHIFNLYFEELASEEYRGYLKYEALMNDPELAEMLGIPTEPTPETEALADFISGLLDKAEKATGQDRWTIFGKMLYRVSKQDDPEQIFQYLQQAADDIISEYENPLL